MRQRRITVHWRKRDPGGERSRFEFLWTEHPALIQEMYGDLRGDDPKAFDAWRDQLGKDTGRQKAYDAFLGEQIAHVDDLFVPNTKYVPLGELKDSKPDEIRASFAESTSITPECDAAGSKGTADFTCEGPLRG